MKATRFLESGGSIKELQELLGHSDIKTTMIYAHLAPEHIKNAINRLK
jgi:site-specific recombinase XerD